MGTSAGEVDFGGKPDNFKTVVSKEETKGETLFASHAEELQPHDPVQKERATLSPDETFKGVASKTETAEIKTQNNGTFIIPQLAPTETIKRHIVEAKLEEVDLAHHEFENEPQTPTDELTTQILLSSPISNQNEEKKKKKVIKNKKIYPL